VTRDKSLDTLLYLNGEHVVVDDYGNWVKFEVSQVEVTERRPHGLSYSLTLHDKHGTRIFGMDNAHQAMDGRNNRYKARVVEYDHIHPDGGMVSVVYKFETPDKLIADFWRRVDQRLAEIHDN
jgi:hypothetical protein